MRPGKSRIVTTRPGFTASGRRQNRNTSFPFDGLNGALLCSLPSFPHPCLHPSNPTPRLFPDAQPGLQGRAGRVPLHRQAAKPEVRVPAELIRPLPEQTSGANKIKKSVRPSGPLPTGCAGRWTGTISATTCCHSCLSAICRTTKKPRPGKSRGASIQRRLTAQFRHLYRFGTEAT